ncbi:hypothetical protein FIBSPDRAFT_932182 [Athelia psychrophila]|uniref:G domain-containing protein n=1 Tax=Athelia psychrophila TaxID=1759441 RepID=A0A166J3R9_9AGAM|nr:hypothetical protein FIBSPDRAFT_932182 [Fibularhizoctonia sp. CBS 109695]
MMAGRDVAQTSSSIDGCTVDSQPYDIKIDERLTVNLWDTAGLNQTSRRDNNTIRHICELILRLKKDLILLIFCFHGRLQKDTLENYQMCSIICQSMVPMAVVVSGLEMEPDKVTWWLRNEVGFRRAGMEFEYHACIAGIRGNRIGNSNSFAYGEAYEASAIEVKAIIKGAYHLKPRDQERRSFFSWFKSEAGDATVLKKRLKKLGLAKKDREEIIEAYKANLRQGIIAATQLCELLGTVESFVCLDFYLIPLPLPSTPSASVYSHLLRQVRATSTSDRWNGCSLRGEQLYCPVCFAHTAAWRLDGGRGMLGYGLWAEVEIVWKAFEGSQAEEKGHRLRAVHMLGPDATSTHRKLAEGHSVDHSAIELLCARAAVADDMIYCITQDGRGPRSG